MNPNTTLNYLTNSAQAVQRFAGQVVSKMQEGIERKPWGRYSTKYGSATGSLPGNTPTLISTDIGNYVDAPGIRGKIAESLSNPVGQTLLKTDPTKTIAATALDTLTNETRKDVWRFTNMHRMVGDVGQYVGPRLGLDSPLAGATAAAAVPVAIGMLSGQVGPLHRGLRPAGYKAVAPVSKEEDPSGKTPISPASEAAMRYLLGQKSQLLAYKDFKEERPDVLPSTYAAYRNYERMKPEAGKFLSVNPETQSFSALGGAIKGTARGLNDPEIRVKGVPVTASAVLGTAAGLGAIKGLSRTLTPPIELQTGSREELISRIPSIGEKVAEKLGKHTDVALLAAGATTAAAVGLAAKKVFAKAAERRVKKEDPIEYLKHKHGSFQQAAEALGQPGAQSWQQLTPYVK